MADYTKDDIKVNYVNQVFEDGDTLTAEHMTKINAGILEAANAEEVADVLTRVSNKIEDVQQTLTDEINILEQTKANLIQDTSKAGSFWKVGEDGGLVFEQGVPVDSTLTTPGAAADSKTVGEKIGSINQKFDNYATKEYVNSATSNISLDNYYDKNAVDQINVKVDDNDTRATITFTNAQKESQQFYITKTGNIDYYQLSRLTIRQFDTIVGNNSTPQVVEYQVGHKLGQIWSEEDYYEEWKIKDISTGSDLYTQRRSQSTVDLSNEEASQYFDYLTMAKSIPINQQFKLQMTAYSDDSYNLSSKIGTIDWTIRKISFGLTVTFPTPVRCGEDAYITCTNLPQIKTDIYLYIDDAEEPAEQVTINGLNQYPFSLTSLTHGEKRVRVEMQGTINGEKISAEPKIGSVIWYDENNATPILALTQTAFEAKRYDIVPINIYPFAYMNGSDKGALSLKIYEFLDEGEVSNGRLIYNKDVISATTHRYNYPAEELGEEIRLVISLSNEAGTTEKIITLKVTQGKYDFAPIVGEKITFIPKKYSNKDFINNSLPLTSGITLTLGDNFNLSSGGFIEDLETGESYFKIPACSRAYLSGRSIFNNYCDSHFKIVFKTVNNKRNNAVFLTTGTQNGTEYVKSKNSGLVLTSHTGTITANKDTIVNSVFTTDEIIDYAFNIVNPETKLSHKYEKDTVPEGYLVGDYIDLTLEKYMIQPYEDGVASKAKIYNKTDISTMFNDPNDWMEMGSDECDTYIYTIRAYDRSLGIDEICQNFAVDGTTLEERRIRYDRNNWYIGSDTNILKNPLKAAELMPEVKIVLITAPQFTNDKRNKVPNTFIQILQKTVKDSAGVSVDNGIYNWVSSGGWHSGQGTSSNDYGFSGRNLTLSLDTSDAKMYSGVTQIFSGTTQEEFDDFVATTRAQEVSDRKAPIQPNGIPVDTFNIKVNIASSENQNNALMAELYNRLNDIVYQRPAKLRDSRVRDTMAFDNCMIFVRETSKNEGDRREFLIDDLTLEDGKVTQCPWHFYGIGNFGDHKDTDATRVDNLWNGSEWVADEKEMIVEITDYNVSVCDFNDVNKRNGRTPYLGNKEEDYAEEKLTEDKFPTFKEILEYKTKFIETDNTEHYGYYEWDGDEQEYSFEGFGTAHLLKIEEKEEVRSYKEKIECSYEFRYEFEDISLTQRDINIGLWNKFYSSIYPIYNTLVQELVSADGDATLQEQAIGKAKGALGEYMIVDSAILYYLFTERFSLIDNRAKNSFWHYSKKYYTSDEAQGVDGVTIDNNAAAINDGYRWDLCFGYDFDTCLGINNVGEIAFEYGLETKDRIFRTSTATRENNETKTHDGENYFFELIDKFGYKTHASIFNKEKNIDGVNQKVSILLDCSGNGTISTWDKKQKQLSEKLWLRDIERKYIRTSGNFQVDGSICQDTKGNYLEATKLAKEAVTTFFPEKANGIKRYHRHDFEKKQSIYMDSRWGSGSRNGLYIRFEGSNSPQSVQLAFMQKCYYSYNTVLGGSNWSEPVLYNYDTGKLEEGQPIPLITLGIGTSVENLNIYPGHQLVALKFPTHNTMQIAGETNFGQAPKLIEVSLGTIDGSSPKVEFNSSTFENCKILEKINIDNCISLKGRTFSLDLTNNVGFKELSAENSSLGTVKFAPNGLLETAKLSSNIGELSLVNLANLTSVSIPTGHNLKVLRFENCPKIDSFNFLQSVKSSLSHLRMVGINWLTEVKDVNLRNENLFDELAELKGIDDRGGLFELEGPTHMGSVLMGYAKAAQSSTRIYDKYLSFWPKMKFEVPEDQFLEEVKAEFCKYNPLSGLDDLLVDTIWTSQEEDYSVILSGLDVSRKQTKEKTYTFDGWKTPNGNIIEPDRESIVIQSNTKFVAQYTSEERQYTLLWKDDNGNPIKEDGQELKSYISYGQGAEYPGKTIPTKASNKLKTYYLFAGWQGYPYCPEPEQNGVDSDDLPEYKDSIDIKARFLSGTSADVNEADILTLKDISPATLNAYCMMEKENGQQTLIRKSFQCGDTIDIELGWDPTKELAPTGNRAEPYFDLATDNVTAHYANKSAENTVIGDSVSLNFDSSKEDAIKYIDTGVQLFKMDEFTLVLDYQFNDKRLNRWNDPTTSENNATQYLLSCSEVGRGKNSLSILRNTSNQFGVQVDENSGEGKVINGRISPGASDAGSYYFYGLDNEGNKIMQIVPEETGILASWDGASNYDRIVIRKRKDKNFLDVYCSMCHLGRLERETPTDGCYDTLTAGEHGNGIIHYEIPFLYPYSEHEGTIKLGCNPTHSSGFGTLCNCTIDTLKIWNCAFSDVEVLKMANYPKEKITLQISQMPNYLNYKVAGQNWYEYKSNGDAKYPSLMLETTHYFRNRRKPEGEFSNGYGTYIQVSNKTGWVNTGVCKWLNSRIYDALPQEWRSMIKNVSIAHIIEDPKNMNKEPWQGSVTYANTHIFVPSIREYFSTEQKGFTVYPYSDESTWRLLTIYDNSGNKIEDIGDASTNNERIKLYRFGEQQFSGFNRSRTPVVGSTGYHRITVSGGTSEGVSVNYKACVDCAFCI